MLRQLVSTKVTGDPEIDSYCKFWLNQPRLMLASITQSQFTERKLLWLIKFELINGKRRDMLHRLTGRFNKLRRNREWWTIMAIIKENPNDRDKAFRETHRDLFTEEG